MRIMFKSAMLALLFSLVLAQPALAYIDPNTGGLLFQLLITIFAFFSAFVLFFSRHIRMAFAKLRRFLRSRTEEHDTTDEADQPVTS